MLGENFEFQDSQMAETAIEIFLRSWKIPPLWTNINLFLPPWLGKILNFWVLIWLKMCLKSSPTKVLAFRIMELQTKSFVRSDSEEFQEISRTNDHFPGRSRTFQDKWQNSRTYRTFQDVWPLWCRRVGWSHTGNGESAAQVGLDSSRQRTFLRYLVQKLKGCSTFIPRAWSTMPHSW